jgi:subtilisin-like proprotein convertase family protein
LSADCENEIYRYCKANFRNDETHCIDFLDVLLSGGTCDYDKLPQSAVEALANGVQNGRDGKGIVYVFASGNDYHEGDDVNMSRWTNSRYTITVGAVGKDGLHTDYSTPGAALHVTAPAGDSNDASHIMTTGLGDTCTDSGPGTSFSAPIVSGVIALMLEARSELTWRDVQGILAVTSTMKNDSTDKTKTTNAAGVTHSNFYGFGIVNAKMAVDTALTWRLWTPEYQAVGESAEENQPIDNNGKTYVSKLEISSDYKGFTAESVVVLLNLQHYNRGDLKLTLVSPGGTKSVLLPGRRPENTQLKGDERWKLMTLRNWGEDPTGTWKLEITDLTTDNTVATGANELRQWKLVVYGRTEDGLPPVLIVASNPPTSAPTLTDATKAPSEVDETELPTDTAPTTAGTTAPTDGTMDPLEAPTEAPTDGTMDPLEAPTKAPMDAPTKTFAPTEGTKEPTTPAPVVPTARPTLRPTGLPTLRIIRPTSLVAVPSQEKTSVEGPGQGPGNSILPASDTVVVSMPSPSGLSSALGGGVQRPTSVLVSPSARSASRFRTFGTEEEESEQYLAVELVEDLSLVLEGVSEIPETSWPSIQLALEQHTASVVATVMPALHFKAQIRLFSVTATEKAPIRERRSLRLEKDTTSVTILYDELVQFDHLPGTEDLRAATLAGLAFKDSHDREAFVAKIHRDFDGVEPMLESLMNVSDLALPPTSPPVSMPTEATVPTLASDTDNNFEEISGYENDNVIPTNDPISEDGASNTITVIASYAAVVGIWCAIMFFVFGRRNYPQPQPLSTYLQ